jgi:hypothetical protein
MGKHFVIVIGGPGLFQGCDRAHDQTWTNYFVPIQIAAQKNLYRKAQNETVHWFVYEPPYSRRWLDDSVIDATEKTENDGKELHSIRKKAADKVKARGFDNYLERIKAAARENHVLYHGLATKNKVWEELRRLPDRSITRVWYSGHAAGAGLFLSLSHDTLCGPVAAPGSLVALSEIDTNRDLARKFSSGTNVSSKFYGCFTKDFARKWHSTFGVPAEGATNKIDFGVIDRPSGITNVLERIEKSPTPDRVGWKVFR